MLALADREMNGNLGGLRSQVPIHPFNDQPSIGQVKDYFQITIDLLPSAPCPLLSALCLQLLNPILFQSVF